MLLIFLPHQSTLHAQSLGVDVLQSRDRIDNADLVKNTNTTLFRGRVQKVHRGNCEIGGEGPWLEF